MYMIDVYMGHMQNVLKRYHFIHKSGGSEKSRYVVWEV
jgi:hypothetical protein